MSTKTATLAKSLHTVTALRCVAELHQLHDAPATLSNVNAVERAAETLGYADAADPYELKARAVAQMGAGK